MEVNEQITNALIVALIDSCPVFEIIRISLVISRKSSAVRFTRSHKQSLATTWHPEWDTTLTRGWVTRFESMAGEKANSQPLALEEIANMLLRWHAVCRCYVALASTPSGPQTGAGYSHERTCDEQIFGWVSLRNPQHETFRRGCFGRGAQVAGADKMIMRSWNQRGTVRETLIPWEVPVAPSSPAPNNRADAWRMAGDTCYTCGAHTPNRSLSRAKRIAGVRMIMQQSNAELIAAWWIGMTWTSHVINSLLITKSLLLISKRHKRLKWTLGSDLNRMFFNSSRERVISTRTVSNYRLLAHCSPSPQPDSWLLILYAFF